MIIIEKNRKKDETWDVVSNQNDAGMDGREKLRFFWEKNSVPDKNLQKLDRNKSQNKGFTSILWSQYWHILLSHLDAFRNCFSSFDTFNLLKLKKYYV